MPQNTSPLSVKIKAIYALGNFGFTILISTVSFFLLIFYTDAAKVAPALAGSALLIGKIWDIVNDPLFGWISDRTRSRFGRRRVFLIYGALPMALTTFFLWSLPPGLPNLWAFIWIALTYILFDTCFTITQVPYWSLGPALTQDYDERTSLNAFTGIGMVLGFFGGSILMRLLTLRFANLSQGYMAAGAVLGVIVGGCIAIAAWQIKEPPQEKVRLSELPIVQAVRSTFQNKPFILLMAGFSLARLGFTLTTSLLAYYVTYHLLAPKQLTGVLAVLMASIGLFIFLWKWVSDRRNKGTAYALGLGIMAMALAAFFWVPAGHLPLFYLLLAAVGFGNSAHWVVPLAMLADVIEHDEIKTGQRREGMYFGVYGLLDKIMRTVGIVTAGWVLQLFGYVANVPQSELSLLGIRLFTGLIPAALIFLALPFLFFYPVTRQSFGALREELARRKNRD